ncbi:hypothetical protein UlMin_004242 [Ulmus minor]
MAPNAANLCVKCLRSEVDIREGLQKHVIIIHCPECDSYLQPPRTWIKAQLESKELLTFCVKRLKNLNKVLNGAVLEQTYAVEFVQQEHMCESCSRVQANPDQRTFFYLEQLILKHGAAATALKIKQMDRGIDFFFSNRSHGVKFVEFVGKTFSVEISPICREDLICLPPKLALSLGNIGPLMICTKVTNSIALLHPITLGHCFLDADQYWRSSFKSILTSRQLHAIVMDVELVSSEVNIGGSKYALPDAQYRAHVIPDAILTRKTYEEKRQRKRGKPRSWKLKSLDMEVDMKGKAEEEKVNSEYEQFLKDLEENPDMRFNISLYRNREYQPSEMESVTDGEDVPSIPLDELLADLDLSEDEDGDANME